MTEIARVRASHSQERMWFLESLVGVSRVYNVTDAYEIAGELDREALTRAVGLLIQRHEALRTAFEIEDDALFQVIHSEVKAPLTWFNAVGMASSEVDDLIRKAREHRFDLGGESLVRFTCIVRSNEDTVLIMNVHHILIDLVSFGILQRDLSALYAAEVCGTMHDLPVLSVQFADYAAWHRQWLEAPSYESRVLDWASKLADYAPNHLPLAHPRPVQPDYSANVATLVVNPATVQLLRKLASENGCTLFVVMLAAIYVVLKTQTGSVDQAVGGLMPGRTVPDVEHVVGLFSNTAVLRTSLAGDPTFEELLDRTRETVVDALDAQDVPFEDVVRRLGAPRVLGRNPLVDVLVHMFKVTDDAMSVAPRQGLSLFGTVSKALAASDRLSFFDIEVSIEEREHTVVVETIYRAELFDSRSIDLFVELFDAVLHAVAETPSLTVSKLVALEAGVARSDSDRMPFQVGPTKLVSGTAVERILAAIRSHPHRICARSSGSGITYAELGRLVRTLGNALQAAGVQRGDVVGLVCDRGLDLVSGLVAILSCGAAVLPMDPGHPPARLDMNLASSRASHVLGADTVAWRPSTSLSVPWVSLSGRDAVADFEPISPSGGEIAYVVSTSGSSGTPKAVAMTHASLNNLVQWHVDDVIGHGATTTAFAPVGFDVSIQEIIGTLAAAGTVLICSEEERRDPNQLLELIRRDNAQWIHLPPRVLAAVCETALAQELTLPNVRGFVVAGESLIVTPRVRDFFELNPGVLLINEYGPSESHVVTWHTLGTDAESWTAQVPIGRPIDNVTIRVLDSDLNPCPPGVAGTIWISGPALSVGYLSDSRTTAQLFRPDSQGASGARMYCSGDVGRWSWHGELEYLGRRDDQIKLRGYRVSPAEVAQALEAAPDIAGCAIVVEAGNENVRLLAYIVPMDGASFVTVREAARAHLEAQLPSYMMPTELHAVARIPLTENGKINSAELRSMQTSATTALLEAPITETERTVLDVFLELMPDARLGRMENFFDAGGHSLLAMMIVARLNSRLRVKVGVSDLFQAPSVALLAQRIENGRGKQVRCDDPA